MEYFELNPDIMSHQQFAEFTPEEMMALLMLLGHANQQTPPGTFDLGDATLHERASYQRLQVAIASVVAKLQGIGYVVNMDDGRLAFNLGNLVRFREV